MSRSLSSAFDRAWNLALTLMVTVIVFQAGDGGYGVMPEAEYDGDESAIVHAFDPYGA